MEIFKSFPNPAISKAGTVPKAIEGSRQLQYPAKTEARRFLF
jgi:hypothetical protein